MDCSGNDRQNRLRRHAIAAGALALALVSAAASADGARIGQKAKPGEIVVIRNVATRPADRNPVAPGMALLVSASPQPQLGDAINGGEASDAEIAALNAGPNAGHSLSSKTNLQRSLDNALGVNTGGNSAGAISGAGNGGSGNAPGGMGGAAGAASEGTRGIADQVSNTMSQIPFPSATGH